MLEKVKKALRIQNNAFNDEVEDLIASAREDLIQSGVSPSKVIDEEDPLISRAIVTFAKAEFGMDNPDANRFRESYESQANKLSQASDYRELV